MKHWSVNAYQLQVVEELKQIQDNTSCFFERAKHAQKCDVIPRELTGNGGEIMEFNA